jgi:hypothetical protein
VSVHLEKLSERRDGVGFVVDDQESGHAGARDVRARPRS